MPWSWGYLAIRKRWLPCTAIACSESIVRCVSGSPGGTVVTLDARSHPGRPFCCSSRTKVSIWLQIHNGIRLNVDYIRWLEYMSVCAGEALEIWYSSSKLAILASPLLLEVHLFDIGTLYPLLEYHRIVKRRSCSSQTAKNRSFVLRKQWGRITSTSSRISTKRRRCEMTLGPTTKNFGCAIGQNVFSSVVVLFRRSTKALSGHWEIISWKLRVVSLVVPLLSLLWPLFIYDYFDLAQADYQMIV